jgi:hypothetical protein
MKRLLTIVLLTAASMVGSAQEKVETIITTDIVSQYIWRGQELGGVSMQPSLGIAYKGLELMASGSVGLTDPDDNTEIDITASYSIGRMNIGVTDYWVNSPEQRYFLYDAHRTSHVFEANVGYDLGVASIQWYTNFAGNDGENNSGKRAYSSYAEATVPFSLGGCDWEVAVGVVPYATTYYDTSGLAVTNLSVKATKVIALSDKFSLPVFAQLAANPCTQKAYLVFGITLSPL